jgi:hypothetical protein
MGSACTITAGPRIFAVIKPNTGAARENTVLTTQATDTRCTNDRDLFLFENLTFDTSGAFFVQENVWMDLCMVLNATSSSFNQASTAQLVWYVTRSTVSNLTQGLRSFSTQRVAPGIVRGNRFVGSIPTIHGINMIGNIKTVGGSDQLKILSGFAGGLTPKFGQIVAYNKIYNTRSLGNILDFGGDSNIVDGFVLANNLVEQTTNDTASAAFNLFSDSSRDFTNAMVWNNTMVGTKNFLFYNDSGSTARYRVQCTVLNNIFDDLNMKGDLFNPTNAARIGNWSTIFGCGMYGNASLETTNVGAFGAFLPEFAGVSSWAGDGTYTTNYPVFYERLAHDGVGTLPGGGDYRLHSRSPLMQRNAAESYRRRKWVLSHDGNGVVRTEVDPPGVYGDGQVRKGFTE